jgi:hypothetical protein
MATPTELRALIADAGRTAVQVSARSTPREYSEYAAWALGVPGVNSQVAPREYSEYPACQRLRGAWRAHLLRLPRRTAMYSFLRVAQRSASRIAYIHIFTYI